jgi:hypothetical protein
MAMNFNIQAKKLLLTLATGVVTIAACTNPSEKVPDTSGISIELKTRRFDTELYAIDTNNIGEGLNQLKIKFPEFLDYFLDTIMAYGIKGNYADTSAAIREGLKPFLVYKDYVELEKYIKKQYPETKETDKSLQDGFKLMKYYFPDYKVPNIIYLNMGLSRWTSFAVDSNTMCIGLDMFLGDEFPWYTSVGEPAYMRTHRRKEYIPVSVFSTLYKIALPIKIQDKSLLELMLQRGKEKYFVHKVLPSVPDSVLFGFSSKQIQWCEKNEAWAYNFFVKNQLLYSKEAQNVMPYVTDGPFARGMEAANADEKLTPGNIGSWIGYRMIQSYMAQHGDVSLSELLKKELNAETFLNEAKYKPR